MRVADLESPELDYWVAQIERTAGVLVILRDGACFLDGGGKQRLFAPSLDWAHGGPIVERERINLLKFDDPEQPWVAVIHNADEHWIDTTWFDEDWKGATPLIAAMRAYVASKFGDDVPDMGGAQPGSAG